MTRECPCFLCSSKKWKKVASFDKPQPSENSFGINPYYRELWQCINCGLFANQHGYSLSQIYKSDYRSQSYVDNHSSRFHDIMNLPYEKSDNKQRIRRITDYVRARRANASHLLDIGSGMGVFPAGMLEQGWQVTAVDPDPANLHQLHSIESKIKCIAGFFPDVDIKGVFDLITFNKVLEHVQSIVSMLASANRFLGPGGYVYIELPDGEAAVQECTDRQEFYLEHYYAFSVDSIALLARRSCLQAELIERIKDPSGKYTLYAFLSSPQ